MRHFLRSASVSVFLCLLAGFTPPSSQAAQFPDAPDGTYEFVAAQTGPWDDPATWGTMSSVPTSTDDVRIPTTCNGTACRVTVRDDDPKAQCRYLRVEGELRLWIHSDTLLEVETLYVASTGTFRIGNIDNPVKTSAEARIVFTGSGAFETQWDPDRLSRGLVSDGKVRLFGQDKTHMVTMSQDALAGHTSLTLDSLPGDWALGDEIVLTGTYFQRTDNDPNSTRPIASTGSASQDERRTISGWETSGVSFDTPLAYDHERVSGFNLHVVNLTRNLVFESQTTTDVRDRGHVMFRNGDVEVRHAAFVDLGRTDKRVPLDDFVVTTYTSPADYTIEEQMDPSKVTNPRGRYSVHFHRNGTQPGASTAPSQVHGCVVDNSPGWGFVNHSSHVHFEENVAYDFVGAGFVTEAGNELGNFFNNVAIRGVGDGSFVPIFRIVFQNKQRDQPLSDFGFRGNGFWFQGPAIRARNNVANGCDGAGMIWFTTGAPDVEQDYDGGNGTTKNRYSHFPRGDVDTVYGTGTLGSINPRHWDHSDLVAKEKLVISDLPILECDTFTSYGNYIGFRLRFNNFNNNAWYNDPPFDYDSLILNSGTVNLARQAVKNLTLWNNEQGFRMRYTSNTDWTDVEVVNRLAYSDNRNNPDLTAGHPGTEFFDGLSVFGQTFTDTLTIDGYPVAGWIESKNRDTRSEITFNGQSYSNYANFDSWHDDQTCSTPGSLSVPSGDLHRTSAKLTWSSTGAAYLVRFREVGKQPWRMVRSTTNSVTVTGLTSGTQHEFQVVAGCSNEGLSLWSGEKTFTTDP